MKVWLQPNLNCIAIEVFLHWLVSLQDNIDTVGKKPALTFTYAENRLMTHDEHQKLVLLW